MPGKCKNHAAICFDFLKENQERLYNIYTIKYNTYTLQYNTIHLQYNTIQYIYNTIQHNTYTKHQQQQARTF